VAILQVRDIEDKLYDTLRQKAQCENRSISQEVISILEKYLSAPDFDMLNTTREFLNLSWDDDRDAEEIVKDIAAGRKNKARFGESNGVFDSQAGPYLGPEVRRTRLSSPA
jgi:plasmid stability protein